VPPRGRLVQTGAVDVGEAVNDPCGSKCVPAQRVSSASDSSTVRSVLTVVRWSFGMRRPPAHDARTRESPQARELDRGTPCAVPRCGRMHEVPTWPISPPDEIEHPSPDYPCASLSMRARLLGVERSRLLMIEPGIRICADVVQKGGRTPASRRSGLAQPEVVGTGHAQSDDMTL